MAKFSAKVLGGPCDGDVWHPPMAPRDGDVVPCVNHAMKTASLYRFSADRSAWIHIAIVKRDEAEKHAGRGPG